MNIVSEMNSLETKMALSYVLGPLVVSAKLSQIELAIDKIEQNTQPIVFS